MEIASPEEFTPRGGVFGELRRTAKEFEFDLPPGFEFPRHIPTPSSGDGVVYQQGIGAMEAYFWWEAAMISAAVTSHLAGRETQARSYITTLIDGTGTELYRTYVKDVPGAGWVERVAMPALMNGDYSALISQLMKAEALLGFTDMAKNAGHIVRPRH